MSTSGTTSRDHARRVQRAFSESHRLSIGVPRHLEVIHESPELSPPAHRGFRAASRAERRRVTDPATFTPAVLLAVGLIASYAALQIGYAIMRMAHILIYCGLAGAGVCLVYLAVRAASAATCHYRLACWRRRRAPTPPPFSFAHAEAGAK